MPPPDITGTQLVSFAVLGNKHRLDVVAVVAALPQGEWLYARAIADASGVRENQVGPILRKLARAGLLVQETFGSGGGQPIQYSRVDCPAWALASELADWAHTGARDRS